MDSQGNIHVTAHGSINVDVSSPLGIAMDEEGYNLISGNCLSIFEARSSQLASHLSLRVLLWIL